MAWRVLDAQYWGVPQRRRRIALIADFGGSAAGEILFNRKGVSRDSEPRGETRKGAAAETESGAGDSVWCLQGNGIGRADTAGCNGRGWRENQSYTLNTVDRPAVCAIPDKNQGGIEILDMSHANDVIRECGGIVPTLQSRMGTGGNQVPLTFGRYVRRLTPLECERLQGFQDGWTDIGDWTDSKGKKRKTSDASRYKALGNSIALPPWKWVLKRLCAEYERDATMGSLFDGIGGFPLIWEQLNGKGSCLWASEIEEFCIAVTKRRFGG